MAPLGATSIRDNRVLCIFFKTVYFCFKKWYEKVHCHGSHRLCTCAGFLLFPRGGSGREKFFISYKCTRAGNFHNFITAARYHGISIIFL